MKQILQEETQSCFMMTKSVANRYVQALWNLNGKDLVDPRVPSTEDISEAQPATGFFMIRAGHSEWIGHSFSPVCFLEYQSCKNKKRVMEEWGISGQKH